MAESECEIEYLDEDADIVQQCVQYADNPVAETVEEKSTPLLVERIPIERPVKRKRKKEEDDSDYDPYEDVVIKNRKKKSFTPRPQKTNKIITLPGHQKSLPIPTEDTVRNSVNKPSPTGGIDELLRRKKLDIRIPDYDDPLCLPVKIVPEDEIDRSRLKNWNDKCLEHLKDDDLKPDNGEAVCSKRIIVMRNIKDKIKGQVETTIWCKTSVENGNEEKKSVIFQSTLPTIPKYDDLKKPVMNYQLIYGKKKKPFRDIQEVILMKEEDKEGDKLVVYKPKDALSAVYKFVDAKKNNNNESKDEKNTNKGHKKESENGNRRCLKEVGFAKVCAPCYQLSWRGAAKRDKKNIKCAICQRTYVSVYNLLAHVRTHSSHEVRKYKHLISKTLSRAVQYHYKCRICLIRFASIRKLRTHLAAHKSEVNFFCEVGNHLVT